MFIGTVYVRQFAITFPEVNQGSNLEFVSVLVIDRILFAKDTGILFFLTFIN